MQKPDSLIHTKLRLPFIRPGLVNRPRLQARIHAGLRGPLTLITAPAGFGKTTLVAASTASCGLPVAWLSLDENDNQTGRFLSYLTASLQKANLQIRTEVGHLLAASQEVFPETILTTLINDLDCADCEIVLVLDDYQYISSQAIHEQVTFLLEHCPGAFHLVIASRSDPSLPLSRLRARGQMVELRAADLRFTESEAAQFLNDIMGLSLDTRSVAALEERTEGWIAGLQMAALSMRDCEDVSGFIENFSGTNRYILDYLLEEVLASQPGEIQKFLLYTSILDRLTAPLCNDIVETLERSNALTLERSNEILEHLDRSNLFLVPLDDERQWYRYHHLFADLLRTRLDQVYPGISPQLHASAATWFEKNGLILDAIHHASLVTDLEWIERLIEQNYIEMANHGEMSSIRFWIGKLNKEAITQRPWLCLYEAMSRAWFGHLEEAHLWLNEAEKRIRSGDTMPDAQSMLGFHTYVKSRITAMQGDTRRAIELCQEALDIIPEDNLGLQIDFRITLGYEYFLYGDFANAGQVLQEMIRSGYNARAINNPVAGYAILARMEIYQGRLHDAYDLLQKAAQLIHDDRGQHLGVNGLVEVEIAVLLYEWDDVEAALRHLTQGLDFISLWGKADDFCLAYTTMSRIHLALGNRAEATVALKKAVQLVQTCGVFSEARGAVDAAQVRLWLHQGDWSSVDRWVTSLDKRFNSPEPYSFENELAHITQARVYIAQKRLEEAIGMLSFLEESAQSSGRQGRLIEILILKALALQAAGDSKQAEAVLAKSLALAEPSGYMRIFLDEGVQMKLLLAQWINHDKAGSLRGYANRLLTQLDNELFLISKERGKISSAGGPSKEAKQILVEPLSPREEEVLQLIALGKTNQEIARQLIVSPGTVKAHTASIYRKLDVANRTEAVARARQLAILP
jgi:LuxR family transcriptional regulator, maltose regulon positive regulatory protein